MYNNTGAPSEVHKKCTSSEADIEEFLAARSDDTAALETNSTSPVADVDMTLPPPSDEPETSLESHPSASGSTSSAPSCQEQIQAMDLSRQELPANLEHPHHGGKAVGSYNYNIIGEYEFYMGYPQDSSSRDSEIEAHPAHPHQGGKSVWTYDYNTTSSRESPSQESLADSIHPQQGGKTVGVYPSNVSASQESLSQESAVESHHPQQGGKTVAIYPYSAVVDEDVNMESTQETVEVEGEEEEDEDTSSEDSEGEDLKVDLEEAFQADFDFKGNYAFTAALPQAPNPGLFVGGIGCIGLPLSERDARLIIESSAQAPFGHGEDTVIDTKVRDTFEIEPSRVVFRNPAWQAYVESAVIRTACEELGVGEMTTPPRCELYKLLLYQPGGHFLPHQDTEKSPGMFATAILVLPSLYSGGEVHVSHGSASDSSKDKQIFALASSSQFTTSLLAWYTDVMHEVKPIESGYRLALSYNLIHTSPGIPKPTLPDAHYAVTALRGVLRRWARGGYDNSGTDRDVVAYLLEHQYSANNLKMGALKGEDAHFIGNLRSSAEAEGFVLCLANLDYHVSGEAEGDYGGYGGYGRRNRGWYGEDSDEEDDPDDEDVPEMGGEIETSLTVSNLVDLEGTPMMSLPTSGISLEMEDLIPENPFDDEEPDSKDYEGYMGNGAGSVEHWYHRTVLVLFQAAREIDILLQAGGVSYALQRLKRGESNPLSADDRKMANFVLPHINPRDKVTLQFMSDLAIRWDDVAMWQTVIKAGRANETIEMLGQERWLVAMKTFSFDVIRPDLEMTLKMSASLKGRIELVNAIGHQTSGDERGKISEWCNKEISEALSSLKIPKKEDVSVLMSVIVSKGVAFFSQRILPQLVKLPSIFDFWVEFIPVLHGNKSKLIHSVSTSNVAGAEFDQALQRCLTSVIRQWESTTAQPQVHSYYGRPGPVPQGGKVARIVRLAELCILTQNLKSCEGLIALVVGSQGELSQKFSTLYNPLIAGLKPMLARNSMDLTAYPFKEFCFLIIGTYLQKILGPKPRHTAPNIRKIGDGCVDCESVNRFLCSGSSSEIFPLAVARRTHVEKQLRNARDLVTFTVIRSGSPYRLQLTKSPDIVATTQWLLRQTESKAFLASIGPEGIMVTLMGSRYPDVARAIEGSHAFKVSADDVARPPPTAPPTAPAQSSSSNILAQSSGSAIRAPLPPAKGPSTTAMAGKKRKKTPVVDDEVIDLTSP